MTSLFMCCPCDMHTGFVEWLCVSASAGFCHTQQRTVDSLISTTWHYQRPCSCRIHPTFAGKTSPTVSSLSCKEIRHIWTHMMLFCRELSSQEGDRRLSRKSSTHLNGCLFPHLPTCLPKYTGVNTSKQARHKKYLEDIPGGIGSRGVTRVRVT